MLGEKSIEEKYHELDGKRKLNLTRFQDIRDRSKKLITEIKEIFGVPRTKKRAISFNSNNSQCH